MIRKIIQLLGALFALGLVAIILVLGAAHWQVRQVEPVLPTGQDIMAALDKQNLPLSATSIPRHSAALRGRLDMWAC